MLVIEIIKSVLGSMLTKLLTEKFFKWAMMWGAKRLVESTKTLHDDVWYAKVEEIIGD
jgi:hypothetical protein